MPRKKQPRKNKIPIVVDYHPLRLDLTITDLSHFNHDDFNSQICLQLQGEAAEIDESYPLPLLMKATHLIHQISPELILRLINGKRVLIYEHQVVPVIRPQDIDLRFIRWQRKKDMLRTKPRLNQLVINLEESWRQKKQTTSEQEDALEVIDQTLGAIINFVQPNNQTILVGQRPTLLFLLMQHFLYGLSNEVWLQQNNGQQILIYQ